MKTTVGEMLYGPDPLGNLETISPSRLEAKRMQRDRDNASRKNRSVADLIVELLGPFVTGSPLNAARSERLLDCPAISTCGKECLQTILAAAGYLSTLPDCSNSEREAIVAACVRQCEVYFLG